MTAIQIAQAMLDKYGFFVVCANVELPLGVTDRPIIDYHGTIATTYVITGPASESDLKNQCALAGIRGEYHKHMYRAVAE